MKKTKIMVVDDNEDFLEELSEMLRLSGYKVVDFSDPAEAVSLAKRVRPDIILLDLKMDGKSGFQAAYELKLNPDTANIPIIAMTAHFNDKNHTKLLDIYGIKTRLLKPFNPLDLISKIEGMIYEKKESMNALPSFPTKGHI